MIFEDSYRCLACGARGSIEKLLKKINYGDFDLSSARTNFSDFHNPFSKWLRQFSIADFCYDAYRYIKRYPDSLYYLKKRDIDHLIDDQKIGYKDGWYIFPIRDRRGEIISAVARAGEAIQEQKNVRYILPNDAPKVLYCPSWQYVKEQSTVRVTFGIIDSLVLYSMGFAAVSGLTGKAINPDLFDDIRKKIEIIPDFGEEEEARKLAGRLGWRGSVRRLDYPEDSKDVADMYHLHGVNSLVMA